jgi:hypothetical protein
MRNALSHNRCLVLLFGLIALQLSAASPVRAQAVNPELDALLKKGVAFPGGQMRKLRPPTLVDGLSAAAQQKAIGAILAMRKGRAINYQQFTVKNLNTPYVLLIDEDPQYDANQPGHSINLWFVVYADLKTVADPKFLREQFKPDKTSRIDVLSDADLKQRQIVPRTIPDGNEWFVHGTFKMLETNVRVQVQATERVVQTTTKESATIAGQIDRRFDIDAKFPNEWRPVAQGVVGGPPTLYYSSGAYAKVTQLIQPAGALLVEYHFVYDEPNGWFNGVNLLRPKLRGTKTDGDVRKFRRDLQAAE